jgi:saccharopine dehydrogenase (NAD+, L-lysine-forming)
MLYGANGYTGRLISRLAARRELRPLLAGRAAQRVEPLADELGLEARVVDLDDARRLRAALEDVRVVLHAAGPFVDTAQPMVDACLASRTHYLDVTGEIEVFERIYARRGKAEVAGVALIPGVGFDVVPTDGLAAMLAGRLPDATHLELGFHSRGPASPGTSRTIVRNLPRGGAIRADGRIVGVPHAWKTRQIPFADATRLAVSIGWGDVSTAYWSTGIGNVIVYMAAPPRRVKWMGRSDRLRGLFGTRLAQRALAAWVGRKNKGPSEQELDEGSCEVWGEVRNGRGESVCGTLTTPNGYALTADAALKAVQRVLRGVPPGAWTPSRAFGIGFLDELDGVRIRTWAG